jgi:hypothetical protein
MTRYFVLIAYYPLGKCGKRERERERDVENLGMN